MRKPILWLGDRGLPAGRLRRALEALGHPLWSEGIGPDALKRLREIEPVIVLVEVSAAGLSLPGVLRALDSAKPARGVPVFLVLDPGAAPPSALADGCFVNARGLAREVRAALEALPAWQALRADRRRKTAALKKLKRENRHLHTLVLRDDLTELYNLRFFTRSLENEHARSMRYGRQYSLVFIDLDGLKEVNARFGHMAGSRVLRSLGSYFATHIRHIDVAARVGGDEFVIICAETPRVAARLLAERLRTDLESLELEEQGHRIRITASFGVASFPEDGDFPEQVLERADRALFVAKAKGKNRVCGWGDFPTGQADTLRRSPHAGRVKLTQTEHRFAAEEEES